jgi:ribonucleoside-diphosphate reductase alpha subunit
MLVIKRNNQAETVSFDKIFNRINHLKNIDSYKLSKDLNIHLICKKTIELMVDKIETSTLDKLSADICASMITNNSDYSYLGARILISNLYKNLEIKYDVKSFSDITNNINMKIPNYLNQEYVKFINDNKDILNEMINRNYDYSIDYFGYKTLERSYLIKNFKTNETLETIQSLWLRISVAIHYRNENSFENIKNTYNMIGQGKFIHATPTLFNAGTNNEQLSSCYLLGVNDDLSDIFKMISDCAMISKWSGGIGVHISNIRAKGQLIRKTNGKSNGIVPMMQVLNNVAKYVNQSGKRNGSIAVYLEPWHNDIFDFIELRKQGGDESDKCRDLFLALWIPDKFMNAVYNNEKWYLMSEDECPNLSTTYGDEFNKIYDDYVKEKRYIKEVDAKTLWNKILTSQMETGTPYMLFKDSINKRSNQKNLGTIMSSNLCAEIMEYSDDKEYAVCNLASIAVNMFYNKESKVYDYDELHRVVRQATYNLNNIIDINYYPTKETRYSNLKNRPIGIGIQGFADLLAMMRIPFESEEAIKLSGHILETIYHGSLEMSNELAKKNGSYESYIGSPASQGILQLDMYPDNKLNLRFDWSELRDNISKFGLRNSLLTALMPTASTSQILGNNECFEPFTSNLYSRMTLAGNFIIFNKHLQRDLIELGIWNDEIKNKLMASYGSIQNIDEIPQNIKNIYKTVWEIKQKAIIDHAISRSPFVDQSQSMNLFFADPDPVKLTSALMYGWKAGLKTGMYYLRSLPSANAQQFTVEPTSLKEKDIKETKVFMRNNKKIICTEDVCTVCSS